MENYDIRSAYSDICLIDKAIGVLNDEIEGLKRRVNKLENQNTLAGAALLCFGYLVYRVYKKRTENKPKMEGENNV